MTNNRIIDNRIISPHVTYMTGALKTFNAHDLGIQRFQCLTKKIKSCLQ